MITIIGDVDAWGFIPQFLSEDDPRDARAQFHERYPGWFPIGKLTLDPTTTLLRYPGDPPFEPISFMQFRDEMIVLYPHAIVLVLQRDGTWEAARMD